MNLISSRSAISRDRTRNARQRGYSGSMSYPRISRGEYDYLGTVYVHSGSYGTTQPVRASRVSGCLSGARCLGRASGSPKATRGIRAGNGMIGNRARKYECWHLSENGGTLCGQGIHKRTRHFPYLPGFYPRVMRERCKRCWGVFEAREHNALEPFRYEWNPEPPFN